MKPPTESQMPKHIAQLPRDDRGWPVTWASAWSDEFTVEVRPDPLLTNIMGVEAPAYFSGGKQYEGLPCISYPSPQRVRQSVIEGFCQVCGAGITEGPWLVCDIRLGQDEFRYGKRLVPLVIDAWTCERCIDFSLQFCPNLSRRETVEVWRVHQSMPVPTMERPKWIPDSVPYGPIGFVKIAVLEYELDFERTRYG